jgi:hypothetical protein
MSYAELREGTTPRFRRRSSKFTPECIQQIRDLLVRGATREVYRQLAERCVLLARECTAPGVAEESQNVGIGLSGSSRHPAAAGEPATATEGGTGRLTAIWVSADRKGRPEITRDSAAKVVQRSLSTMVCSG